MPITQQGAQVFVSAIPQPNDLTQTEFEAIADWVLVDGVGNVGETGVTTNIVNYDEHATRVTTKAKGVSNAGDPVIECRRIPEDPGQIIMRQIGDPLDNRNYAFRRIMNDAPDVTMTATTHYWRGLCTGPTRPNGANEDFDLERYTLGLNQLEITVNPTTI